MAEEACNTCIIHFPNAASDSPASELTADKLDNLLARAEEWLEVDKNPEAAIAGQLLTAHSEHLISITSSSFHKQCYLRFASASKIDKARNSKRKIRTSTPSSQSTHVQKRQKLLRSQSAVKATGPVLPAKCVICSKDKTIKQHGGAYKREALSQAETLNAGGLLEAATLNNDSALLVHISGDCVAMEVRYHRSCHKKYLRAATYAHERPSGIEPNASGDSLPRDASLPTEMSSGTDTSDSESSVGSDYDSFLRSLPPTPKLPSVQASQVHTAMQLRQDIRDKLAQTKVPWPPSANDLSIDRCMELVPPSLYNFMAVMIGAVDHQTDDDTHVNLKPATQRKVLSICQDIMSAQCKGNTLTPKSIALGMAVRHLSGSSHLSRILSGLGHSCSYDTIMRMETGLALQQLNTKDSLPAGFTKNRFTVLVYDNIDFAEETLSGAGSTHHTNGIMFQLSDQSVPQLPSEDPEVSRRERSFQSVPSEISPFFLTKRVGPADLETPEDTVVSERSVSRSITQDFAYLMMKAHLPDLPGWTPYNINLSTPLGQSVLHYLPVIEASPTELSTVRHILDCAVQMADQLESESVMVVFDQAIYSKAQQICWDSPTAFKKRLVVRMGEFHTIMCFLSVLGKRFSMSGFEDILVESEAVAVGSMKGVVSGHMYNRSVRAHKLLFEALGRLQMEAFLESNSCSEEEVITYKRQIELMGDSYRSKRQPASLLDDLEDRFSRFIAEQCASSATYAFWSSYMDMMYILLAFIRATRTGDWDLHLASLRAMLPWMFAYDRTNYARYAPIYWLEMCALPNTHPWLYDQMVNHAGSWTLQRHTSHGFCSLPADQAIETTINRESKMSGGIKGITLTRGAVQRWVLAQPVKSAITARCDQLAGIIDSDTRPHKEGEKPRIERDEQMIRSIQETIRAMVNPWTSGYEKAVSLSSGATAAPDVELDLAIAHRSGEEKLISFIDSRLLGQEDSVFATVKTLRLKTFATPNKKAKKSADTRTASLKADRSTFARLLIVSNQRRDIDLPEIFTYSLSPVSAPLSSADGCSISKTTKAALLATLEAHCDSPPPCVDELVDSAIQIDAMALVQSFPRSQLPTTFGQLSHKLLLAVLALGDRFKASRIDVVGDRYDLISIKNIERDRRAHGSSETVTIYGQDQKLPKQWTKFLASSSNKQSLQAFLASNWPTLDIGRTASIYVALTQTCCLLTWSDGSMPATATPQDALASDHEEADTRLVLHAAHATSTGLTAIIWSPDTDVAVIALGTIAGDPDRSVWFATGTGNRRRVLDLSAMAAHLGQDLSAALIGLHSLTGCDSTSSFYGRGKKAVFKSLLSQPAATSALKDFGKDFKVPDQLFAKIERFVCHLYGSPSDSVNHTRYTMFCSSTPTEKSLPPTQNSLRQHAARASYQAAIWRRATVPLMDSPPPSGHGWHLDEQKLCITWMTQPPAPPGVLKTINCGCKKGCKSSSCSCVKAKLPCTPLCACPSADVVCGNVIVQIACDPEESDSEGEM